MFVYFRRFQIYLLIIFLLRCRCLTHLCLCLPFVIILVLGLQQNRKVFGRKIIKIFADLERYNLFQFSAIMNFNGGDITHTLKQEKTHQQ